MEFLNGATLEDVTDQDVAVGIWTQSPKMDVTYCRAFLRDGRLCIDCVPARPGKYVSAVPDDAIVARAEGAPPLIMVRADSDAGRLIRRLMGEKLRRN